MNMDLKELLTKNRTCRTFDESRPVTRAALVDMVEHARLTPTAMNRQPLCYRLVTKRGELEAVQSLTKWGGALPEWNLPPEGHRPTGFIVIGFDKEKFGSPDAFLRDVGIVSLAITLRACEMGYGSCIISAFKKAALEEALHLPPAVEALQVIGIGTPDEVRRIVPVTDGKVAYYRDENGVHCVPKRSLDELILPD